jgi:hypothetical protein
MFFYPKGKPRMPHLLRCQGLAVKYYGFALGRLGSGTSSVFATTGTINHKSSNQLSQLQLNARKNIKFFILT